MYQLSNLESQDNLTFLFGKLLSLRHIEYVTLDREFKICEISSQLQQFAELPYKVAPNQDIRTCFPEFIGLESTLVDIFNNRLENFQLQGIARVLENGAYLYLNLYIFSDCKASYPEKLIAFYEDVTDALIAKQEILQVAHETSLLLNDLISTHDYIDKIFSSIAEVLFVIAPSGKIKKVNQAAQCLFGYSIPELMDRHFSVIAPQEDLLHWASRLSASDTQNFRKEIEVICKTKTGAKVCIAFSCSAVFINTESQRMGGTPLKEYVFLGRDVTEKNRIQRLKAAQYSVARILSTSTSLEQTTSKILQALCQTLGWDIGEVWLPKSSEVQAFPSQFEDSFQETFKRPFLDAPLHTTSNLQRSIVWWRASAEVHEFLVNQSSSSLTATTELPEAVWQSRSPQQFANILENINDGRSHLATQATLKSASGFPIYTNCEMLGVMTFWGSEVEEQPFDEDLLQMMMAIGSQLGQFFKRKQTEKELQEAEAYLRVLYEQEKHQSEELILKNFALEMAKRELEFANRELQRLASVDGLTQLGNRRCFDETLACEWQRLMQEHLPLSLILGDIDFFKLYNDCYGHQAGDECLKTVAQVLQQNSRWGQDLVARYGGEELAIILPNTNLPEATRIARSIQQKLQQKAIPHAGSKASPIVTLSMGIATTIPDSKSSLATLIAEADKALYQAKLKGRNRTIARSF